MPTEAPIVTKRKLIEVALPLDAINGAAAREKNNPFLKGHPRSMHLWWAPRPLAAARAVLFGQMVDDPSSAPDLFPTKAAQQQERERLFEIIEALVKWENTTNEELLDQASAEIWQSWRRACTENADHPQADEIFNRKALPVFHDPFAGGGAIPLEAQRLGFRSFASDLNPVASLISKAKIEIPVHFARKAAVNPSARSEARLTEKTWRGAEGLADDVMYYGKWMRDEAARRIGHLYPKVLVTGEMAAERPDLEPYVGRELTVIAWLWARTVKSPNPAFADIDVPLASTFILSKKKDKEAWVEPTIEGRGFRFEVRVGTPPESAKGGTKIGGSGSSFYCLLSRTPMTFKYLRSEAKATGLRSRLMAIVAEGDRGRVYLTPTEDHERIALNSEPKDAPETALPETALGFRVQEYAMTKWRDLFTGRQLVALTTFSELVSKAQERVRLDAIDAGLPDNGDHLRDGGIGASAYAEAVALYLGLALSKWADYSSTISTWNSSNQNVRNTFSKQAVPMTWDYCEVSPLNHGLSLSATAEVVSNSLRSLPVAKSPGRSLQADCASIEDSGHRPVIQTDPPYYANIGYADLSDFFYVWLRSSLRQVFPELFATVATPKALELIATPFRHGGRGQAEEFFLLGMTRAMQRLATLSHVAVPITLYYAYKQSEGGQSGETARTGWETFLSALIEAGLAITGTWPLRTERGARSVAIGANALASSILVVCRPRPSDAPVATRREFQDRLGPEFPEALRLLKLSNIAPVDLAQASIGPGMRIFTQYREVLNADGSAMTVREALALINATLDEVLTGQDNDYDSDSRWAVTWFEQHGFDVGEFGDADTLAKAKAVSVEGLEQAGVLERLRGKVRLLRPSELSPDWDPAADARLTVWEMTHHLIRLLESAGETAAADLAASLGARAEVARNLAYSLYVVSDRKKRAEDARQYNGLVQSWSEIMRLAQQPSSTARQANLEFAEE